MSFQKKTIIFIDGSYFIYHTYFSVVKWFKITYPDTEIVDIDNINIFTKHFIKIFVETVNNLSKNLNIEYENPIIIIGRDCKRKDIWRNEFYDTYKGNRTEKTIFICNIFEMVYKDNLFQQCGAKSILIHPKLEADDCIAISVKYLLQTYNNININIITSDKDYLQLAQHNVKIFNLGYINISENTIGGNAHADLFCKIIMGDKSDNITSVLNRCGPVTALKCYNDKLYFDTRMNTENAYEKFKLNQKLIDFNYIPQNLIDEFINSNSIL